MCILTHTLLQLHVETLLLQLELLLLLLQLKLQFQPLLLELQTAGSRAQRWLLQLWL